MDSASSIAKRTVGQSFDPGSGVPTFAFRRNPADGRLLGVDATRLVCDRARRGRRRSADGPRPPSATGDGRTT